MPFSIKASSVAEKLDDVGDMVTHVWSPQEHVVSRLYTDRRVTALQWTCSCRLPPYIFVTGRF